MKIQDSSFKFREARFGDRVSLSDDHHFLDILKLSRRQLVEIEPTRKTTCIPRDSILTRRFILIHKCGNFPAQQIENLQPDKSEITNPKSEIRRGIKRVR